MSIINLLPQKAQAIETFNRFSSTFNVPTIGVYDFTNVAANQRQVCLPLTNKYYYLIERVSFSASIDEGTYLESINTQPQAFFNLQSSQQRGRLFRFPFPAVNYKDNLEWSFWFNTQIDNDSLLITFEGVLNQVPATVGIVNIFTQFSFVIYLIDDLHFVTKMRDRTSRKIGDFYTIGV